jgi:hypothetical protein
MRIVLGRLQILCLGAIAIGCGQHPAQPGPGGDADAAGSAGSEIPPDAGPCPRFAGLVTLTLAATGFDAWNGQPVLGCFIVDQMLGPHVCGMTTVTNGEFTVMASACTPTGWAVQVGGGGFPTTLCLPAGTPPSITPTACLCPDGTVPALEGGMAADAGVLRCDPPDAATGTDGSIEQHDALEDTGSDSGDVFGGTLDASPSDGGNGA